MKTQYVLRIEHPETKTGPFTHKHGDIMPLGIGPATAIYADLLKDGDFNDQTLSGVEYMSHIYEWFGSSLTYLYDAGFRLYMYLMPADKVLRTKSGLQVGFRKEDVIEITEID